MNIYNIFSQDNEDKQGISEVIPITIVVFLQSLISVFTMIYSIGRGLKYLFPKYFMGTMIITGLVLSHISRGITSFFFLMQSFGGFQNIQVKYQISNFIYIPNACFILFIFPLFWQMLIVQYGTRIKKFDVMNEVKKNPPERKWAIVTFWIIYIIEILVQTGVILDFNFGQYNPEFMGNVNKYLFVMTYLNYIECFSMIIVQIILFCRVFSGFPIQGQQMQKKNRYIMKLINYCIVTRILYAALISIILEDVPQIFSPDYDYSGINDFLQFLYPMLYFILYILFEFIPAFFTLDIRALRIFQMNFQTLFRSQSVLTQPLTSIQEQFIDQNQASVFLSQQQQEKEQQFILQNQFSNTKKFASNKYNTSPQNKLTLNRQTNTSTDTESAFSNYIQTNFKFNKELQNELSNIKSIQNLVLIDQDNPQTEEELNKSEKSIQSRNSLQNSSNICATRNSEGLKQLNQKSSGGFGKIQIYQISKIKLNFMVRSVPVKKISSYLYEEIVLDFKKFRDIRIENIEKPVKIFKENNFIHIAYPLYINGSLRQFLESSKFKEQVKQNNINFCQSKISEKSNEQSIAGDSQFEYSNLKISKNQDNSQLSIDAKIKICLEICQTMYDLHQQNIIHGHLHMQNILIDSQFSIAISGLGQQSFKKFLSFNSGYCNIGYYTAPEFLEKNKNKYQYINNPTPEQDVYSFAFILFEMFYDIQPFQGLNLAKLRKLIVEEDKRPKKVQEKFVPDLIDNLIDNCWISNPELRPNFSQIMGNLKRIQQEISIQ